MLTFGKGRLSSITRAIQTISYGYDHFGRLTQDGSLAYGYDVNGNRTRMSYPNSVTAVYTHDFADREATLASPGTCSGHLFSTCSGTAGKIP